MKPLLVALISSFILTANGAGIDLVWTEGNPEVGNFLSLLEESGEALTEETPLTIRGKLEVPPPEKRSLVCSDLSLLVDSNSGRTVSPALYLQLSSLEVSADVFVERGILAAQRGALTWRGVATLGGGNETEPATLELLYSLSQVDGNDLTVKPNGVLAFRIYDVPAVQRIVAGRPEAMDLEGKLELHDGAKLQIRFGEEAIADASIFVPGEYQLIRSGGIDGELPELVVMHELEVVDNGRFSLRKDGNVLLLVVSE